MRNLITRLALLLILSTPMLAQEMATKRTTYLLVDKTQNLNSVRKDTLSGALVGRAFPDVFNLPGQVAVRVYHQTQFVKNETISERGVPTPKTVKRTYKAAFVEVLSGQHQGKQGWVVVSYQDPGERVYSFLGPKSKSGSAQRSASSRATSAPEDSVDLVVDIYKGKVSPTGGRLYSVGVVNKGGVEWKGQTTATIKIGGKLVRTERIRGPLRPNQAYNFTVPVHDRALRTG